MIQVITEQHQAPQWAERALLVAGGLNTFGEPNYRLVWGWSRLGWIGGEWKDRNPSGDLLRRVIEVRKVPRYMPFDRWHLERWCPPELYGSPRNWYRQTLETYDGRAIEALGPYPYRGDYEHSMVIDQPCLFCVRRGRANNCAHRQFVQLTPTLVHRLARAVEFSRSFKDEERVASMRREIERRRKEQDAADDETLNADPAPISRERRDYVQQVLAPQLGRAMHKAERRNLGRPAKFLAPKASAGLPKGARRK